MKNNIPDGHVSKKKKNTYIISFNTMLDKGLFAYRKYTPMPLIIVNGQEQKTQTGWIISKELSKLGLMLI